MTRFFISAVAAGTLMLSLHCDDAWVLGSPPTRHSCVDKAFDDASCRKAVVRRSYRRQH